ncbi:DUF5009 domain-containing protein [Leptospira kobayashii]|uniref:DUF5009 domain-containing protein n=1 Tax=Leptospira kobayashii TaxID=1917830 RepID=A0ABM7UR17_9LEPT|nr:hypothetical protein [Leptospira kobayashii]BDA78250.1 DUF5009 domain-containing protein [Leptospira kobayashii]
MSIGDRNSSLDALRGLAVFLMLIVNLPGSWSYQYSPFKHAAWNGFQLADLVFPLFLWIVGFSISFGYKREGTPVLKWEKILIRTCILIFLGLFLNLFPKFSWENFRIPGVLQRIGIVYLLTTVLLYTLGLRRFIFFVISGLFLYSFFVWFTIPNEDTIGLNADFPLLDPKNNWASFTDRLLFGAHVWKETSPLDPEGCLSTIPALSTVLFGFLLGLRSQNQTNDSSFRAPMVSIFSSVVFILLGIAVSYLIPLNKTLWSISFVFLTAGISQFLYQLLEFVGKYNRSVFHWLSLYGKYALFVFVFTGIVARLQVYSLFRKNIFQRFVFITNDTYLASFLFSILMILVVWILLKIYEFFSRIRERFRTPVGNSN